MLQDREGDRVSAPSLSSHLYIFLDEGGNFDFSPRGTSYFALTALTTARPFVWDAPLMSLKYDEIERGSDAEYFHAAEDKQIVRNRVFAILTTALTNARLDCMIVEKRKTVPELQTGERLYPAMLGHLLKFVVREVSVPAGGELIVMTDAVPVKARRRAVESAVSETLARKLPAEVRYRVLHHDSKSCLGLQVADYCNWAIYRKWDRGDTRSYGLISGAIGSEFDIFRRGKRYFY